MPKTVLVHLVQYAATYSTVLLLERINVLTNTNILINLTKLTVVLIRFKLYVCRNCRSVDSQREEAAYKEYTTAEVKEMLVQNAMQNNFDWC